MSEEDTVRLRLVERMITAKDLGFSEDEPTGSETEEADDWPEPEPLGGELPPVEAFGSELLPDALRPLVEDTSERMKAEYEFQKEEADLRHNAWRDLYKAAQKSGDTPPIRPDNTQSEPVLRRLITHDATFEKLHEMLAFNPAGILVNRDELSGWFETLDKLGRKGEQAFFLTAWNGDSGFTMDRIGRGSIHVEHCCISILGAITPARLRSYLVDTLEDGPTNDGLLQRFQLSFIPTLPGIGAT